MIEVYNNFIHYTDKKNNRFVIKKENYKDVLNYISKGFYNPYIEELKKINVNIQDEIFRDKSKLIKAMKLSLDCIEYSLPIPNTFNIELTTKCPLRCPQCYCYLDCGKNIDLEIAKKYIIEAGKLGINYVNLSGGETLAYPYLKEIIACCKENEVKPSIAISGWNFSKELLSELIDNGIEYIFVSLNGSTEEINSKSRDGYGYAINALKILKNSNFHGYFINWVAHNDNIKDFHNMVRLAKYYRAKGICILSAKPDSNDEMKTKPTIDNFKALGDYIKTFKDDSLELSIENCYSSLRFYVYGDKIIRSSCLAGKTNFSISVNGRFTACRHIEHEEEFDSIKDYWKNSSFLYKLRRSFANPKEPCLSCEYNKKCTPCAAVNYRIYKKLFKGNEFCYVSKLKMEAPNE